MRIQINDPAILSVLPATNLSFFRGVASAVYFSLRGFSGAGFAKIVDIIPLNSYFLTGN